MSYLDDFINTMLYDDIKIILLKNKNHHIENPRIINCDTWNECWESVENLGLINRRMFSMNHQNLDQYDAHEMYLCATNVKTMRLFTGVDTSRKEQFSHAMASVNHMVFLLDSLEFIRDRDEFKRNNKYDYDSSIYLSKSKSNLESDFKVKGMTIIIY